MSNLPGPSKLPVRIHIFLWRLEDSGVGTMLGVWVECACVSMCVSDSTEFQPTHAHAHTHSRAHACTHTQSLEASTCSIPRAAVSPLACTAHRPVHPQLPLDSPLVCPCAPPRGSCDSRERKEPDWMPASSGSFCHRFSLLCVDSSRCR